MQCSVNGVNESTVKTLWTKLFLPAMLATILLSEYLIVKASASVDEDAEYLNQLGLFKGTNNGV